ncbi:MAG: TolC family protein, partial [Chlamydiia bacterium]|nr:TolC family protein [Chlamydiia bacterium]
SIHALIGVAYSTYFPNIRLTSALGSISPSLSNWMTWASRFWQIGADIAQVLFNVGRNSSYVNAAKARFEDARGSYEKACLMAFSEVEDALNDIEQQRKESEAYHQALISARQVQTLSSLRYEKGITNLYDVIDAEKTALDAERQWMNVVGQRYQSAVQLIKAIGGEWEPSRSPCCPAAKVLSEPVSEEVPSAH